MVISVLVYNNQQQLDESSGQPEKTFESTKVLETFWSTIIKIVKKPSEWNSMNKYTGRCDKIVGLAAKKEADK